jgi:glycosyltransferase involved in cell wall biosynthesis
MQNKEGTINLLKYVWPKIKEKMPEAKLKIAGRHSKEFVESTGLVRSDDKSVEYGEIDNPKEVYSKSWVLVAPIRSGGGSRTKFFEAMACGLPVVTTPSGIEGIEAKNDQHVVVVKDFDQLAKKTVCLMKDEDELKRIGRNGQELIRSKYSWKDSADKLLKIYQDIS